jgi:hypothetical protein|tara:strand:+ start:358 stop:615 length:258 start_codon:yes stop_codon:yes gene_type:complete
MSNARLVFGPNPFDLTENGDKNIGSFVDEARSREEIKFEDKDYQAFFQKSLKKFGVSSPAELKGGDKKKFYDYIDANWTADKETD